MARFVTAEDLRARLGRELDALRETEDALYVSKRGRLTAVVLDSEHFRNAIFLFTDDSAAELQKAIGENEFNKRAPEEGFLLASRWNAAIRNISGSFELRLIDDVLTSRTKEGFFFAAMAGNQLGNFDFIFDPRVRQQITVGRFTSRENRSYYDVWTHFTSRSFRGKLPPVELKVSSFDIKARIEPTLHLTATTRMRVIPRDAVSTIALDISPRMKISAVEVNGTPAEVFRPESLRSNLLRGDQNETFLIVMQQTLEPGRECEIVVGHEGDVIHDAGNKVYFVASRINWYPQCGAQFAGFDLTFRYPKALSLITSGELVDERVEGEERISHRRSPVPLRFAGFNLGDYIRTETQALALTFQLPASSTATTRVVYGSPLDFSKLKSFRFFVRVPDTKPVARSSC